MPAHTLVLYLSLIKAPCSNETQDHCIPLIWLFRVTVASATPSPSGPFNTLPVTEKPITWKTGWNGKKVTIHLHSVKANTHLQQSAPTLFYTHTYKGNVFPPLGRKGTRIITQKHISICRHIVPLSTGTASPFINISTVQKAQITEPKALCNLYKRQTILQGCDNLEDDCLFATWTQQWLLQTAFPCSVFLAKGTDVRHGARQSSPCCARGYM